MKVWTKDEFIANEKRFWDESMGIGFLFKLGKWIGFMVGVIICYQIINADLSDHMLVSVLLYDQLARYTGLLMTLDFWRIASILL